MSKLTLILSISSFIVIITSSKDLSSPLSCIALSFASVLDDGWRHSERPGPWTITAKFLLFEQRDRLCRSCTLYIRSRCKLNAEPSAGFENVGKLKDKTVGDRYAVYIADITWSFESLSRITTISWIRLLSSGSFWRVYAMERMAISFLKDLPLVNTFSRLVDAGSIS